ncbi:MAG: hypothetical protein SFT92_02465 [Rickettsiales bacterium]|nr:hypothetical protein [Rickettsiales bacterium]
MTDPNTIPTVLVDTGTLLTLLLGGESKKYGCGYTKLLETLAKNHIIKLETSDMVIGEFFGVNAPIYAQDLKGRNPLFSADQIQLGYALREERYELIKRWVSEGLLTIHKTKCGNDYLQYLQELLEHNPDVKIASDDKWPPGLNDIRKRLLFPRSKLARSIRGNYLLSDDGETTVARLKDRGEISLADIVFETQGRKKDINHPMIVLYEGSDVRSRIIWRLHEQDNPQIQDNLPPLYNPNNRDGEFLGEKLSELGNISFLSTKGFIAGLAYAGLQLDNGERKAEEREHHIVWAEEAQSVADFDLAYQHIIGQVVDKGLSRVWDKRRDEPIGALIPEDQKDDVQAMLNAHQPWKTYLDEILKGRHGAEMRQGLQDAIEEFTMQRDSELRKSIALNFQDVLRETRKLPPDVAADMLESWIGDMHAEANRTSMSALIKALTQSHAPNREGDSSNLLIRLNIILNNLHDCIAVDNLKRGEHISSPVKPSEMFDETCVRPGEHLHPQIRQRVDTIAAIIDGFIANSKDGEGRLLRSNSQKISVHVLRNALLALYPLLSDQDIPTNSGAKPYGQFHRETIEMVFNDVWRDEALVEAKIPPLTEVPNVSTAREGENEHIIPTAGHNADGALVVKTLDPERFRPRRRTKDDELQQG